VKLENPALMLLDTHPKLEDIIVSILAINPGLTPQALHRKIVTKYGQYSMPAIYQELRKLRERAVCVKIGDRFSLRLGWTLEMAALFSQAYTRQVQSIEAAIPLPKEGSRETWKFRNLRYLGQFWTQLILKLCATSADRTCFEWAPHAWFSLSHTHEESQFIRAMRLAGNKYYLIIGSDTALSRSYTSYLTEDLGEASFAEGPFTKESSYFSQAGNFLVQVDLGDTLVSAIERLFTLPDDDLKATVQGSIDIFEETFNIRLTLYNRSAKAKKVRRAFCDFFGVRL
jgi:hypothetical protein